MSVPGERGLGGGVRQGEPGVRRRLRGSTHGSRVLKEKWEFSATETEGCRPREQSCVQRVKRPARAEKEGGLDTQQRPRCRLPGRELGDIELGCGFYGVFSGEWAGPWVPHAASNQSSSALV